MTKKKATATKKPVPILPAEPVDKTILPTLTERRLKFSDSPLALSREAILLNYRAFDTVKAHDNPLRRGLTILGTIVGVLLVARLIQLGLGFLTTPRFDILSTQILERVTQLPWYLERAAANPDFAQQFTLAYDSLWQMIRIAGGYPSPVGTISSVLGMIASLMLGWLSYGAIAHLFARWFGAQAELDEFLGPLALSYAPMLLVALEFIPGFGMARSLIFGLMLVTKFIAIRRTYLLSPGYSLAVVVAPFVVGVVAVTIIAALGIGFGLGQVPYLNPIFQLFTS